ncbi:MAG: OmpA family protein [Polyangiaceae bacterium]|nr:OmpA family protein [Polyangiaceae bacterium]MCB9610325.1 OmpA family protein [Polyangiaceae bacterium]
MGLRIGLVGCGLCLAWGCQPKEGDAGPKGADAAQVANPDSTPGSGAVGTSTVADPPGSEGAASGSGTSGGTGVAAAAGDDELPATEDLMTFARGAIPLKVGGSGASQGAKIEEAIESIDGSSTPFTLLSKGAADSTTELVYQLPAETTFDGFAVPNVWEVPSKFTTFTQGVEVHGSATGPDSGYTLLAKGTLKTHEKRGQQTELEVVSKQPAKWIKLRLSGGILIEADKTSLQFSELIGRGSQAASALATGFKGNWGKGNHGFELTQSGAAVSGCYDGVAPLSGTVSGNILRARGEEPRTKVVSLFVLTIMPDGSIRGVRSTNGAPFKLVDFSNEVAAKGRCPSLKPPVLGCGSILHGINFKYNSAEIQKDSETLLAQLFASLKADKHAKIRIEGHTSSEGSEAYNLDLSKRRAEAVVADLTRRGLPAGRISAVGRGEASPIASNADETGRSLNRRVEVHCD